MKKYYELASSAECCWANNQDCTPCAYKEFRGNGCVGRLQHDLAVKVNKQGQELSELRYAMKKVTEYLGKALETAKSIE